ncbi:MAG: phosphotransferase [Haloarculaceae archaeon]
MADDGDTPRDDEVTAAADAPAFRAALEVACPGREPATVEHLGRGNRKLTRLVSFESGGSVVVQLAPTGDRAVAGAGGRTGLRAEALVLRAVRERTDVPVPAVLADGTVDGTDYLVTERADGEDLHEHFAGLDGDAQRRLARTFGRHLGAVHDAFSFEGYGPLDAVDGTLEPREAAWEEWFVSYGRAAVGRLPPAFDDLRDGLEELLAALPLDPDPPATLFPWDFRPGNALFHEGELTAVLDWERPLSAAPALSVAKAEYLVADWYVDDPAPLRAAFRAGYGSLRPVPDIRPGHRAVAVAASAVDTAGVVTRPSFPERDREGAVTFHRRVLERVLDGTPD